AVVGDVDHVRQRRDPACDLRRVDAEQAAAELGREGGAQLLLRAGRAADDVERADREHRGLERSRVGAYGEYDDAERDDERLATRQGRGEGARPNGGIPVRSRTHPGVVWHEAGFAGTARFPTTAEARAGRGSAPRARA